MRKLLSDKQLAEIEMRVAATQPGPWKSFVEGRDHTSGSNFIRTGKRRRRGEDIELTGATVADLDFIAAARQDIPLLLEEVRTLRVLLAARQRA